MSNQWKGKAIRETNLGIHVTKTLANSADGNIFKVYEMVVSATRGEVQKKGAVKYFTPAFTASGLDTEVAAAADEFCRDTLIPYLNQ